MASLPARCTSCGYVFPARGAIAVGPGVSGLSISNVGVDCPRCDGLAMIGDGVYSTTTGELALDSGPPSSHEMLRQLTGIAERAKAEKLSADEIIAEIADVNPDLAAKLRTRFPLPAFVLLIVLFWIVKSVSLNLSFDVNHLVDQAYHLVRGQDPEQHLDSEPPLPTNEPPPASAEDQQPKKESRQARRQRERQAKKRASRPQKPPRT